MDLEIQTLTNLIGTVVDISGNKSICHKILLVLTRYNDAKNTRKNIERCC
jgi:hypothetical protein